MITPEDRERWKAKLDQIEVAFSQDQESRTRWEQIERFRHQRAAEGRALVENLIATTDFEAFRAGSDQWSRREGPYYAFSGFGQMWLNQVVNNLPQDPAVVDALLRAFATPVSPEEAQERFAEVTEATRDRAGKGRPAVGMIPFVLSVFWSTDPATPGWPILWSSISEGMSELGWLKQPSPTDNYAVLLEATREFNPEDVHRIERLMWFLARRDAFVGLNPTLGHMCSEAGDLIVEHARVGSYEDAATASRANSLAIQIKGELFLASKGLLDELRSVSGLDLESVKLATKVSFNKDAAYRADAYASWSLPGGVYTPSYRLWATRSGVAMGVHGGWDADDQGIAQRMVDAAPDGYRFFAIRPHKSGDRLAPGGAYDGGDPFVGQWWTWDELPQGLDLRREVVAHAERLRPVLHAARQVTPDPDFSAAPTTSRDVTGSDLTEVMTRFRQERPYPNDKDEWHKEQRAALAEALSAENLPIFDLDLFRQIVNGNRYGLTGPQSVLNASLRDMDSLGLDTFANHLHTILWGHDEVGERIDRALDWDDLGTKGLGESVLLKLFAICQPDRFLPVFPLTGPKGKIAMLRRLGLEQPDGSLSRGHQHLAANDALRAAFEPLLPGDPWGQAQFGYWLLDHDEDDPAEEVDYLAETAERLFLPEDFLGSLGELLQEKGQMIFYGPPGTGKTYIADAFAAAIQPDPERRMLVQFHPSMSYEDFFEGYRPQTDPDGHLRYELRPGPLALMADKAEKAPGVPHILIIDEINRANLPRVFGELLFLLEYRNKSVRTAYRPDEPFELPKNLYFIGTMNTADRSIAVVDAALRRRFHFIPFMPHEGPLESVLFDWLVAHGEPTWVAALVDQVNEQLRTLLRGPHLQVGHSHFMVQRQQTEDISLTNERLARIWEYDIYPFIEDQLYGRPDQLEQFTWPNVHKAFGPGSEVALVASEDVMGDVSGEPVDPRA